MAYTYILILRKESGAGGSQDQGLPRQQSESQNKSKNKLARLCLRKKKKAGYTQLRDKELA